MNWTREQSEAINIRNKNVLVAAAAGSGKTAVLVERIRKLVCEENVPVSSLLVVTFTKAAAAEMKEKIRKSLTRELRALQDNQRALSKPVQGEFNFDDEARKKIRYIKAQLSDLPQADICTFHAFALTVIRRFFYLIDIEPGLVICDEVSATLIQQDVMDELIEDEFESFRDDFKALMDAQSSDRNPNKIRDLVFKLYTHLMAMPYPNEWMEEVLVTLSLSGDEFEKSTLAREYLDYISESIESAYGNFDAAVENLRAEELERMAALIEEAELAKLKNAREKLTQLKAEDKPLGVIIEELAPCIVLDEAQLRARKDEKEAYDQIKGMVKDLRDSAKAEIKELQSELLGISLNEKIDDINATESYVRTLFRLVQDFDRRYSEAKTAKRYIDFNDIEHKCLAVLEHEEARKFFKDKFAHIFIDEYQDTNFIQEEIIGKIKRENNIFMVGDVKQSIYSFRLAEPQIFEDKYQSYSEGLSEQSKVVDLNKNYRSKEEILSYVNRIFEPIMRGYDDRAALHKGLDYDGQLKYEPELHVLAMDLAEQEDESDKAIQRLKKSEAEAKYIAELIKKSIGTPFFDSKQGKVREIKKSDIVILMRGVKSRGGTLRDILQSEGVDSFINDSEGYFDTIEINIFMSLLSVIDNMQQDVALINILHSEIFGLSAEELARIRADHRKGSFYESLKSFAECEESEPVYLKDRTAEILETLHSWRLRARIMNLPEFIWELMIDSGYYLIMGTQPAGTQKQANLRALVEYADKFSDDKQSSLYGFVRYVDSLKKRNVKLSEVKMLGEGDDVVKIMTIHKSKGLEFPMVIVAGMNGRLQYSNQEDLMIHKDIGVGLTLKSLEGHWKKSTLVQKLIGRKIRQKEKDEEERILYVALTRARDILYLVGTVDKESAYESKSLSKLKKMASYLDMVAPYVDAKIVVPNVKQEKAERKKSLLWKEELDTSVIPEAERDSIEARLGYEYPHKLATDLKSKYSVSEINVGGELEISSKATYNIVKHQNELKGLNVGLNESEKQKGKVSAAKLGTIYHKIMEVIDFSVAKNEGYIYVEKIANECVEKHFFTAEELEQINLKKICGFFDTEIGTRAAEASKRGDLFKEKPFTFKMSYKGSDILVQGIIDCYFREAGRTVLIDYKSSYVSEIALSENEERIANQYRKQIDIYAAALGKAGESDLCEAYIYLLSSGHFIKMSD